LLPSGFMTYISSLPSRFDTKAIWPVPADLRVGVGGGTVGVDVGGSGVLVGGAGVSVGGTGVSVGVGVAVGPRGMAVIGGTGYHPVV
jgi:hypothetical protein